jgi:two-component system, LuxR family, sensor kinase FixL
MSSSLPSSDTLLGSESAGETAIPVATGQASIEEVTRLRASELHYRRFFETANDGALILDFESGTIHDANPFLLNLLGYSLSDLLGKRLWDIGLIEDRGASQATFEELQKTAYVRYEDLPLLARSGQRVDVEFISSVYEVEGRRVIQCNIRDIRERKATERRLASYAVQLQRSNQELENFAYVASHDLQEPLRKIQAFGERLRIKADAELSPESQDYVVRMQNAASRMQTLINDLLTFSRVARTEQSFTAVDLTQVVHAVLSDLEQRIRESGGQLIVEPLPTIQAAPLQMRQLFQNLISNSLKYHRPSEPLVIRVTANIEDDYCELTVADNGIGFDNKFRERIFGIFQRLHGRTEYEGTGIGLAICRKIVERHHGTVTASGERGNGATFTIRLPLQQNTGDETE